ncbi:bacteriocin [Yersinia mollaretii]|uniref:bacteriocin n=1 Tax=Yersinia mollaretii TaxID=33060 RepID=UPI0011A73555|nr:bacteriocin [Yersinia mollaretii]
MGYGLIDVGRDARQQASLGLRDAAERETQREYVSQQFRRQRQQGKMNLLGLGAGAGMAVGATYGAAGGPVGLGIGAAVGLLASRLF